MTSCSDSCCAITKKIPLSQDYRINSSHLPVCTCVMLYVYSLMHQCVHRTHRTLPRQFSTDTDGSRFPSLLAKAIHCTCARVCMCLSVHSNEGVISLPRVLRALPCHHLIPIFHPAPLPPPFSFKFLLYHFACLPIFMCNRRTQTHKYMLYLPCN